VASNSKPGAVTPTITGSNLNLIILGTIEGTAEIVLKATDAKGNTATIDFSVDVDLVAEAASPYAENFEVNDGSWVAKGANGSWSLLVMLIITMMNNPMC
jgi:hypothetical protein